MSTSKDHQINYIFLFEDLKVENCAIALSFIGKCTHTDNTFSAILNRPICTTLLSFNFQSQGCLLSEMGPLATEQYTVHKHNTELLCLVSPCKILKFMHLTQHLFASNNN